MKKLLFLYNTHAGKGLLKNRLAAVQDALAAAGWDVTIHPTQGAGVTVLFLIVLGHFFGQDQMLLISLGAIVLCLLVLRDRLDEKEEETC